MNATAKLSPTVRSLLQQAERVETCRANVLMARDLSEDALEHLLKQLELVGAREIAVRPSMAMVHALVPVPALPRIADMKEVDWIDVEKSAPLQSVID